jgi:hypothetical protein
VRRRAGSLPLSSGGAFPEFTAYVPTLTPTMAATHHLWWTIMSTWSGIDPTPLDCVGLAIVPVRPKSQAESSDRTRPH